MVECNEKDELKSGYTKLDEQYKKQATDIAKLKHECLEKEKELDEMNNTESKEEHLHIQLDKQTKEQAEQLNSFKKNISLLKERSQNWDKFKHIDMTEITSIVEHNKSMGQFLDAFLNRFSKLAEK